MVPILNNIKVWWLEKRLVSHEIKRDFNKNFLPIKTNELQSKFDSKIAKLALKKKHDLLPLQIRRGVKSDFLRESFDIEVKELNEKYYWKKREIIQTLKRENNTDETLLVELENKLEEHTLEIKDKYYQPSENLDKDEYETKVEAIENSFNQQVDILTTAFEIKKNKFVSKTTKEIEERSIKAIELKKIINASKKVVKDGNLEEGIILKLDELSMHFGGLKAVDSLSFEVKEGEIFGLIGPNGAGKTTVFNCITRFYKPTLGDVYFKNNLNETVHLNDKKVHNIIKQGIVRTFQNVEMIWELNVMENLLVAAHTQYRSGFFGHLLNSRLLRQEEVIMRMKAEKILKDLDLLQYEYYYPMGLPYGILKKIELARTLMVNPKLIILDEPAAGLNDTETDVLAETIKKIRDEYHTTIFLVEHDMGLVMDICDTVCAISFGKKLAIGTPKEIQSSKLVREAYLGGE